MIVYHAPGQIEEPFLRRAFGKGTQKVWSPVRLFADFEGRSKYDLLQIGRDGSDHFVTFLNPKVHGSSTRSIFKGESRKVATDYLDGYFVVL